MWGQLNTPLPKDECAHNTSRLNGSTDLPAEPLFVLILTSIHQVNLPSCVTPSLKHEQVVQEYLACCPSPTPIGLGLGID